MVPSVWAENSPLVIHEVLQARVPVITADYGGMAEYVHHERNGLLFAHRDPASLAQQMQRLGSVDIYIIPIRCDYAVFSLARRTLTLALSLQGLTGVGKRANNR